MSKMYGFGISRRLIVADSALDILSRHIQLNAISAEAGGILLGRHLLESPDLVIDEATVPQSSDKRRRFSFFRSATHSDIAAARWRESGGKTAYLGLWHTHPEDIPTPSATDIQDWNKALVKDRFDGDMLFFIIIGREELGCWVGNRQGAITKLSEIT